MRGVRAIALAISTSWRSASDSRRTVRRGSRGTPSKVEQLGRAAPQAPRSIRPNRRGSRPMSTLAATSISGNSDSSWATRAMPSSSACRGVSAPWSTPSISIVPASGAITPVSTFTNVDLPAPFSPSRASTSPARIVRSTPARAAVKPKRLEIPRRCAATGAPAVEVDDVTSPIPRRRRGSGKELWITSSGRSVGSHSESGRSGRTLSARLSWSMTGSGMTTSGPGSSPPRAAMPTSRARTTIDGGCEGATDVHPEDSLSSAHFLRNWLRPSPGTGSGSRPAASSACKAPSDIAPPWE